MAAAPAERDILIINRYAVILQELGIDEAELVRAPESKTRQMVSDAIREKMEAAWRPDHKKAAGLGEVFPLGSDSVEIRPMSGPDADRWRELHVRRHRDIYEADDYSEDELMQEVELRSRVVPLRRELLAAYIGQAIPDEATDPEVKAALEVAERFAFPFDDSEEKAAMSKAIKALSALSGSFPSEGSILSAVSESGPKNK